MTKENVFSKVTEGVYKIIQEWETVLAGLDTEVITSRRNNQNRNIKQLLGHLIDSASNNHQRMVRLQYNRVLEFPDYQHYNDRWIAIQKYDKADWETLIQIWKYSNLHMIHVISTIDPRTLSNYWYNFSGDKVTLEQMIRSYLVHLNLHMGQIKELMEK